MFIFFIKFNKKIKKISKNDTGLKYGPVLNLIKKWKKRGDKRMWQFILGLVIGANVSLILYAIIIAGKRSEE